MDDVHHKHRKTNIVHSLFLCDDALINLDRGHVFHRIQDVPKTIARGVVQRTKMACLDILIEVEVYVP